MNALNEQEQQYVIQLLLQRPLGEAMALYLKLTDQQLTPVTPAAS